MVFGLYMLTVLRVCVQLVDPFKFMGSDAHQLALAGATERVLSLLDSGETRIAAVKNGGIYNGWSLLHCAASKARCGASALSVRLHQQFVLMQLD